MEVHKRKALRFHVLQRVYEETVDNNKFCDIGKIGKELGLNLRETAVNVQYLDDQDLIKMTGDGLVGRIDTPGVIEVESATSNPDKPTNHFPANIVYIINQGNIIGGDVGGDVIGDDKVGGDKVGRDKIG